MMILSADHASVLCLLLSYIAYFLPPCSRVIHILVFSRVVPPGPFFPVPQEKFTTRDSGLIYSSDL